MKEHKIAVVDFRMDKECRKSLEDLGLKLIDSYYNKKIYNSISGHVDINMFTDGENIVVSPESYSYYKEAFERADCHKKIISGKSSLSKKYPGDTLYNVCYTGKYYIANFDNVDYEIKRLIYNKYKKNNIYEEESRISEFCKKTINEDLSVDIVKKYRFRKGYEEIDQIVHLDKVINIKQGYSNCSICQVDENSIITYDEGIAKILKKTGINVLKIDKGHIELFDFNYGFIGGASANFLDKIVFFGSIKKHPDYERIRYFIEEKGKKIVELSNNKLIDYGSMFVF